MLIGTSYRNAQEAFEALYEQIHVVGEVRNGTRRLTNVGFTILNPMDNEILTPFRNFNLSYARREFSWYLSGNRDVRELAKHAPIWNRMHNGSGIVNSNYGYQWGRNAQLEKCIQQLVTEPETRQAWLTIFDGKEKRLFDYDTPCTLNIGFEISNDSKLNMQVLMRSNDLWYGFCNDQYCFSSLQYMVANRLGLPVGSYYHYAADMHLYKDKLGKK